MIKIYGNGVTEGLDEIKDNERIGIVQIKVNDQLKTLKFTEDLDKSEVMSLVDIIKEYPTVTSTLLENIYTETKPLNVNEFKKHVISLQNLEPKVGLIGTITPREEIHEVLVNYLTKLYEQKNNAYGNSFKRQRDRDPNQIFVRLYDKVYRAETLYNNDMIDKGDETIKDTFLDLANYAIMEVIEILVDESEEKGILQITDQNIEMLLGKHSKGVK